MVEVANVKAEVRLGMVEVEEAKYLKFKVGAEEEPNLIMSESKKAPPLTESFSAGEEVAIPMRPEFFTRKVSVFTVSPASKYPLPATCNIESVEVALPIPNPPDT